ncbi:MAG: signal peptide peptidase SppA [bacterium]|nr:signal peptide peptidase SppA [bacterium]
MKKRWMGVGLFLFVGVLFLGIFLGVVGSFFMEPPLERGDIALITIEGPLYDATSLLKQIEKIRKRDDFKAVVVRIDSPGGTVAASQEVHDAIIELKKNNKRVVVSMGNVAASGGYYVAAPADWIVANPGTITGSIGVRLEVMNMEELLKLVRLKQETLKSGQYKDIASSTRPMTPEERRMLEGVLKDLHQQFKEAVQSGRGLKQEEVDLLADGRIFTGRAALEKHLVDELGSLSVAIDKAAKLGNIIGEPKVVEPPREREGFVDYLFGASIEKVLRKFTLETKSEILPVFLW